MIAAGERSNPRNRGIVMRRLLVALALIGLVSDALAGEFEMPTLRGASTDYAPTPIRSGAADLYPLERLLCRRAGRGYHRRHRLRRQRTHRWSTSPCATAFSKNHVTQLDRRSAKATTQRHRLRRFRRLQLPMGRCHARRRGELHAHFDEQIGFRFDVAIVPRQFQCSRRP